MWYCMKCGTENKDEANFCPNCGSKGPERKNTAKTSPPPVNKPKSKGGCLPLLIIAVLVLVFFGKGFGADKGNSLEAALELWSGVVQIEADEGVLAALTEQGSVYIALEDDNGLKDAQNWKDIVQISLHGDILLGLDSQGRVQLATKNDNHYISQDDLSHWPEMKYVQAGDNAAFGIDYSGMLQFAGDELMDPYYNYQYRLGSRDALECIDIINAMPDSQFFEEFGESFDSREDMIRDMLRWNSLDDLDYNKFCLAGVSYLGDSFAHYFSYSNAYIMPELYGEIPRDVEFGPDNCLLIHTINDSVFLAEPIGNNVDTGWYDSVLLGACDAVWGGEKHVLARKLDGSTVACGDDSYGQCQVSDWSNVQDAALCSSATFAVVDGRIVAAGQMDWDGEIVKFG